MRNLKVKIKRLSDNAVQKLFREFKWQDGTPCGVKEE